MKPSKISIKVEDDLTGEKFEYKLRMFFPNYENIGREMKRYLENFTYADAQFIVKMIRLYHIFGTQDLMRTKSINIKKLIENSLLQLHKHEISGSVGGDKYENENLLETALFKKNTPFNLLMSEESYISFRESVLNEIESVDAQINTMMENVLAEQIDQLGFMKKIKYHLVKKKKVNEIKDELKEKMYLMILETAKEIDNDIEKQNFHIEALSLIENFQKDKYQELIEKVLNYFSKQKGENIAYINQLRQDGYESEMNNLFWIVENTVSRSDAFDLIRLEAESIYIGFMDWFHKREYEKLRGEMEFFERRAFQLLFFKRKIFYDRIPVFEPMFKSFMFDSGEEITAKLTLLLIFKKREISNINLEEEMLVNWRQYLSLYPSLVDDKIDFFEILLDKTKCIKYARQVCSQQELEILKWFLDGINLELISIKSGIEKKETIRILEEAVKKIESNYKGGKYN
ncbi:TPA: hypothetical protein ACOQ31_001901 [Bacillus cereus]|uniref:hypothetical protein n=1 Tax=Bacillus cereus group TaxID=86661 RepID=UPI0019265835|nr:hypothetical protein [Bacillus cereus]MBL3766737.1 hypothetical protein [Bacillus cereus]MBL3772037.1 hypothetical protein [Bacillus cereus]MBL3778723.1 hypothetical protein [Bacillus cereus]MBL3789878.1 hypothetical protein [Bacillus cereus]